MEQRLRHTHYISISLITHTQRDGIPNEYKYLGIHSECLLLLYTYNYRNIGICAPTDRSSGGHTWMDLSASPGSWHPESLDDTFWLHAACLYISTRVFLLAAGVAYICL
jgi:hypothetical protein